MGKEHPWRPWSDFPPASRPALIIAVTALITFTRGGKWSIIKRFTGD